MNNIFTPEALKKYSSGTYGIGEWVKRNGIWSMRISPASFYYKVDTEENKKKTHGVLSEEINPKKRYLLDLWIDSDDIFYSGVNDNVPGGIGVLYSDGSSHTYTTIGNKSNPKGFQHLRLITEKDFYNGFNIYYYINTPAYYRWDSSITEIIDTDINKQGIINTGILSDNSESMQINNGGGFIRVNLSNYKIWVI